MDTKKLFSAALLLAGMLLIIGGVGVAVAKVPTAIVLSLIIPGAFLMIVGVYSVYNVFIMDVRLKSFGATFTGPACIQPRVLSHQAQTTKTTYAESQTIPGITAPLFNSLEDMFDLSTVPGGNPMVPSYMLDKNYRILDWNQAFSLAFDRTMEGRRGKSVLEWTSPVTSPCRGLTSNPFNTRACATVPSKQTKERINCLRTTPPAEAGSSPWTSSLTEETVIIISNAI
jgi:hypothetical protein